MAEQKTHRDYVIGIRLIAGDIDGIIADYDDTAEVYTVETFEAKRGLAPGEYQVTRRYWESMPNSNYQVVLRKIRNDRDDELRKAWKPMTPKEVLDLLKRRDFPLDPDTPTQEDSQ